MQAGQTRHIEETSCEVVHSPGENRLIHRSAQAGRILSPGRATTGRVYLVKSDPAGFTNPLKPPLHTVATANGWTRVARGVYLDLDDPDAEQPKYQRLHAARVLAAADRAPAAVVSHHSAAVLHGLPLLAGRIPKLVHVTRDNSSRHNESTVPHRGKLRDDEVVTRSGVRCTSLERTVQDLAGHLSPHELLALADAAVARGADLASLAARHRNRRALAWAAANANGRAESFGESWSRYLLLSAGITLPMLQAEVSDDNGLSIARTDFVTEQGLIGEFDGKIKYTEHVKDKESAADVIVREKRREALLAEQGFVIVRWDWDLLANRPEKFIERWQQGSLRAASLPAPRGTVSYPKRDLVEAPEWDKVYRWKVV